MEALLRVGAAAAQHLEQVLVVNDSPVSSPDHGANLVPRPPGPEASMEDLIGWEEQAVGCSAGGRCACSLVWNAGTHFVHKTSAATSCRPSIQCNLRVCGPTSVRIATKRHKPVSIHLCVMCCGRKTCWGTPRRHVADLRSRTRTRPGTDLHPEKEERHALECR